MATLVSLRPAFFSWFLDYVPPGKLLCSKVEVALPHGAPVEKKKKSGQALLSQQERLMPDQAVVAAQSASFR